MKTDKIKKKNNPMSISEVGRMGGQAVAKKHGKEYMRELGKKGAEARWGSKNANKK